MSDSAVVSAFVSGRWETGVAAPPPEDEPEVATPAVGQERRLDTLPSVVISEILACCTYEELAPIRQVNKFFKRHIERRLNEAFFKLGRDLSELSVQLKKRLPRKESERKDHPMNRYSDIVSAVETRYTMLAMTFKKYLDAGVCCFIPGKVLDLCFRVVAQIRDYVRRNLFVQLNVIHVMRDIRDYSTMATEHFELQIVPTLAARYKESRRGLDGRLFYSPYLRSSSSLYSPVSTYDSDRSGGRSSQQLADQLDAQTKQVDDLRKLLNAQTKAILHVSEVVKEVSKFLPAIAIDSVGELLSEMNSNSVALQSMLKPAGGLSRTRNATDLYIESAGVKDGTRKRWHPRSGKRTSARPSTSAKRQQPADESDDDDCQIIEPDDQTTLPNEPTAEGERKAADEAAERACKRPPSADTSGSDAGGNQTTTTPTKRRRDRE
ncbi:hypothetical protein M3Y99_01060900 [Aphelenchoides fujianensis]|nr:hypothetical protein M3Y99_01060900 [Aphelenchoides fujianensis]